MRRCPQCLTTRSSEQRLAVGFSSILRLAWPASVAELGAVRRLRFPSITTSMLPRIFRVTASSSWCLPCWPASSCLLVWAWLTSSVSILLSVLSDDPLHHWRLTDTLGVLLSLFVPSLIFVVGFYLRRAGTPPSPNNALQRTRGSVGAEFLAFSPPSLSLEALGALPLPLSLAGTSVPVPAIGSVCSRSFRGRGLPSGTSRPFRSAIARRQRPSFPRRWEVCPPFPRLRSHAPNHALQRTEAGGGLCSEYRVLLRQPLSLSLDSLGTSIHAPRPTSSQ